MKKLILTFILIFFGIPLTAQEQHKYPCDSISMSLRSGAKAVIRSCQRRITIVNEKLAFLETRMAITLLNDQALNLLMVGLPYDDLRNISGINARVYNETGKLIWTLNKYNIQDRRNFNGPQKLDDSRKRVFEIPSFNYPFTIEYTYKITARDLFMSPSIFLQPEEGISVEESGLQYVIPDDIGFHFKSLNFNTPVDSVRANKKLYITWKIENIPAARHVPYATSPKRKLPVVYGTPLEFNLGGIQGSFKSWDDYSKWMGALIKGRDKLDSVYINNIKQLIDTCASNREIIKVLYKYLQKSTHYFYIGFGIGASQPIPANDVAKSGYGDCKALCNYMKAMLKYAGIKSFYTLAPSGEGRDLYPDIPCNQFDHVILCVPDGKDTIWLECTDPDLPFNYLGSFTSDRYVLAITEDGGKLLRTPVYDQSKNIVATNTMIRIDSTGTAMIKLTVRSKGLMSNNIAEIAETRPSNRKIWFAEKTGFSAFHTLKESFTFNKKMDIPEATVEFIIEIRNFASISGKRMVLSPSFYFSQAYLKFNPTETEIERSYQEFDTVLITIPSRFEIYYAPGNRSDSTIFGSYITRLDYHENVISYYRNVSFKKGVYPVSEYQRFHEFINLIARGDREKIVLSTKN